MSHAFMELNWIAVIATAVIGFLFGWLWYSPLCFAKPWMKEMKLTDESMKEAAKQGMAKFFIQGFIYTVISTMALAMLVRSHAPESPLKGAMYGAFLGALVVGARMCNASVWEMHSMKLNAIKVGHEIGLFALQAAIFTVWH